MDEHRLDGNAAGGALGEIFPFEMTTAKTACANCASVAQVGAAMVYASAIGTVVRCATCDNALIRVVSARGRYWLDLRGVRYLQIDET